MHVPDHGSPTLHYGVCGVSHCHNEPGGDACMAALSLGYTWEIRNPLSGLEPPFYVCPACAHSHDFLRLAWWLP